MNGKRTSWLNRLTAKLFKKKEPPPSLEVGNDGFAYVRREGKTAVRWADVKEIFAFKRAIFAVNLICIGFRVSDSGEYWEINEEMSGYKDVLAAATKAFLGLAPGWWHKVAFLPLTANVVTLWGQQKMAAIWQPD